ncbi:hypothetical protein AX15_002456 [Amanita polypyramis BW_CC]|nr:hypothetical protein AX15_002456 [Amanita polypyramis BW_CC]
MEDRMEPLEKLFRQVEEESERRAQIESQAATTSRLTAMDGSNPGKPALIRSSTAQSTGRRRGGSVSMTRFGQPSASDSSQSVTLSLIASRVPFCQTQQGNDSFDSFIAGDKEDEEDVEIEDDHLVTYVHKVTTRGSFSKAVGDFLPRRLSRSGRPCSEQTIPQVVRDVPMVVGVQVEQATVEVTADDSEEPLRATVHAPNSIRRRTSLSSTIPSSTQTWLHKARDLTQKFRQRSKTVLSPHA